MTDAETENTPFEDKDGRLDMLKFVSTHHGDSYNRRALFFRSGPAVPAPQPVLFRLNKIRSKPMTFSELLPMIS